MAVAKNSLSQKYINWVWAFILIDYGDRQLCGDVLCKKEKWQTDLVQLYKRLETEQSRICRFENQR